MTDVYIIIPVYKGLEETAECLGSVARHDTGQKVVVINDASPDPEVTRFLKTFTQDRPNFDLIENKENLGFVKSVNKGLGRYEDKDVILLNNDTIVTPNWVEKLKKWAYGSPGVATVTPLSNNATICSYPKTARENSLPENQTPDQINQYFEAAFAAAFASPVELPTGVGFCMYIRRHYLSRAGWLDAEAFDKGYGEENDFCLKCSRLGGRHLAAVDTFVFHRQSVSFGETQRRGRTARALDILRSRYPEYDAKVRSFQVCDPLWPLMRGADFIRFSSVQKKGVLFVDHGLGGGTARHIRDLTGLYTSNGWRAFILKPFPPMGVTIESGLKTEAFLLIIDTPDWLKRLARVCRHLDIRHLHFHHLKGYSPDIFSLPQALDLPYFVTLHDYFAICPRTNGYIPGQGFCGFPDNPLLCRDCLAKGEDTGFFEADSWRATHLDFLAGAQKVIAPSKAAKRIFHGFFPELKIFAAAHPEVFPSPPKSTRAKPEKSMNIGLIGGLSEQKGRDVLAQCVVITRQKNLPFRWVLMGSTDQQAFLRDEDYIITGPFNGKKELARLVEEHQIHLVVIPALWPETYSYVLSEAWWLGLPVLAPDLGAFSERMTEKGAGVLLPHPIAAGDIVESALAILRNPKQYKAYAEAAGGFAPVSPLIYWKNSLGRSNSECPSPGQKQGAPLGSNQELPEIISNLILSTHTKKIWEVAGLLKKQLTLTRNHERNLETFNREIHNAFQCCKTQLAELKNNIEELQKSNTELNNEADQLRDQTGQLNAIIRKYKIHWVINTKTYIKYNLLKRKEQD